MILAINTEDRRDWARRLDNDEEVIMIVNVAYYMVELGDTLPAVAEAFRVDVESLIAINPEIDPDHLIPDQAIAIPGRHRILPPYPVKTTYKPDQ